MLNKEQFRLHTDSYFHIGTTHHVCQDYARTHEGQIFVSDGCSGSKDTDFGSRFMVMSAIGCLNKYAQEHLKPDFLYSYASLAMKPPYLPDECLDASLMTAYPTSDGYIKVQVFGDGVVIIRQRTGDVEVYDIDMENHPVYPAYFAIGARMQLLRTSGYGTRKVTVTINGKEDVILQYPPETLDTQPDFSLLINPKDVELITLVSDGCKSFQDMSRAIPKPIQLNEIVPHLIGYKTLNGSFVARRIHTLVTKECSKLSWQHYDDLAVASIYIEELNNVI